MNPTWRLCTTCGWREVDALAADPECDVCGVNRGLMQLPPLLFSQALLDAGLVTRGLSRDARLRLGRLRAA